MDSLIHLIYASVATSLPTDGELSTVLLTSRANNVRDGVTGMLLYIDGSFFQVLEGPPDAVDRTFARIAGDPRHARPVTIIRERIPRRSFGEWSMGYASASPTEVARVAGLNDFFDGASCVTQLDPGRAQKLLTAFRGGRWRAGRAAPQATGQVARSVRV